MKLHYNSPVILTYTLVSVFLLAIDPLFTRALSTSILVVQPGASLIEIQTWVGIFGHVMGHADWNHLLANFAIILLIGPILEEKYGSGRLLSMIFFTALATGLIVVFFFREALIGASGVAFMMILLGSFANAKTGRIPLTFILVAFIYLGREVFAAIEEDHISQMAHIIGGVLGSGFGFIIRPHATAPNGVQYPNVSLPPTRSSAQQYNKTDHTGLQDFPELKISKQDMRYGMDDE
jgi:membrane associated rhomboid family serine protease